MVVGGKIIISVFVNLNSVLQLVFDQLAYVFGSG